MALTQEELQEKRDTAATLQAQIVAARERRATLVADKEREALGEALDTEIDRLRAELESEEAITAHQEAANLGATNPEDFNAGAGEANAAVDPVVSGVVPVSGFTPPPADPPALPVPDLEADAKASAKGDIKKENS